MTEKALPSVFINCPFDAGHEKCHNAIILCATASGMQPRSALETGTVSVSRMQRIGAAMRDSKYSIHDLTKAYGEPTQDNLARFNMPFEFGMAFLLTNVAPDLGGTHEWLGLVPGNHPRAEFISDLAGYDLESYDGKPESVIAPVLSWLSTRSEVSLPPSITPKVLAGFLPELETLIEAQKQEWRGHLTWNSRVSVIRDLVASRLT
jgi:hypothetical protein